MTIIAVVGDMMLADSFMFRGETGSKCVRDKVVRLPDGSLLGACGYCGDIEKLYNWAMAGMDFDNPPKFALPTTDDNMCDWLHLRLDRTLWRCTAQLAPYQMESPSCVGVNQACILWEGAVMGGCNPIRAMELTIAKCAYVGGDVDYKRLGKPHEPKQELRNGTWDCPHCYARNRELHEKCLSCCAPRQIGPGPWWCDTCGDPVPGQLGRCAKCGTRSK